MVLGELGDASGLVLEGLLLLAAACTLAVRTASRSRSPAAAGGSRATAAPPRASS
ncbi:hypothetical protein [Miltoncostaea marina]|uniref:hypothetical protein n=1 Tax=Miltoncostaea marina TaxID=2843215 RepID=UPI001C3E4642|nr:hypothetical protein [Miltoncostaea marina]